LLSKTITVFSIVNKTFLVNFIDFYQNYQGEKKS